MPLVSCIKYELSAILTHLVAASPEASSADKMSTKAAPVSRPRLSKHGIRIPDSDRSFRNECDLLVDETGVSRYIHAVTAKFYS